MARPSVMNIIESYVHRKQEIADAKAQEARNRYLRALDDGANVELDLRKSIARLERHEEIVETVTNNVHVELKQSKLRLKSVNADLEVFDLELEARKAAARAKIARDQLAEKQANDALNPPPPDPNAHKTVEEQLDEQYDLLQGIRDETEAKVAECAEKGEALPEPDRRYFIQREKLVLERIEKLVAEYSE